MVFNESVTIARIPREDFIPTDDHLELIEFDQKGCGLQNIEQGELISYNVRIPSIYHPLNRTKWLRLSLFRNNGPINPAGVVWRGMLRTGLCLR